MKRSIFLLVLCSLFCSISVCAQDSIFYYHKGKKIPIMKDPSHARVIIQNSNRSAETMQLIKSSGIILKKHYYNRRGENCGIYAKQSKDNTPLWKSIRKLVDTTQVIILPCYKNQDGDLNMSQYLYIGLKHKNDTIILNRFIKKYHLIHDEIDPFIPSHHILRITPQSIKDPLIISNEIYESGLVAYAYPDFNQVSLENSYDEFFNKQWNLFNLDSVGIDIKTSAAWSYTTGKGIKIAIIDNGMPLYHEDLDDNLYLSYDTETGTDIHYDYSYDSEEPNLGGHGTHCAGIATAVYNNETGISGVAPDASLMVSSTNFNIKEQTSDRLARAINWAWINGADVISCSWSTSINNANLEAAIDAALSLGRNGKGCIVVFCVGNYKNEDLNRNVKYPANYRSELLVVGGISKQGELSSVSRYGSQVDVVAPGESIYSCVARADDAYGYKSGTSMATPHVAGLAALILERNPNLTGLQVRNIIEQNTTKVDASRYPYSTVSGRPNGTWNLYYGYGLINAYEAVKNTPRW